MAANRKTKAIMSCWAQLESMKYPQGESKQGTRHHPESKFVLLHTCSTGRTVATMYTMKTKQTVLAQCVTCWVQTMTNTYSLTSDMCDRSESVIGHSRNLIRCVIHLNWQDINYM